MAVTLEATGGGERRRVVEVQLEPTVDAGSQARELLPPLVDGLDDERRRNLAVVVSELVSNAVQHGPGTPITLHVHVHEDGAVAGEVRDEGVRDDVPHIEPSPDGDGGFGLRLVDSFCDAWGVHAGTTHVWFRMEPRA